MSYDLALGPTNDLVFAANRDLLGVSGRAMYDQRIKTRLKIRRGTWVFDVEKKLGSRLDLVLGRASESAMTEVTAFVHEALDGMDDVTITSVEVTSPDENTRFSILSIKVGYFVNIAGEEAPFLATDEQQEESIVAVQL